jgi:hypothetical protein
MRRGVGSELKVNGRIQYAFRRPRFPIICAAGSELISAVSEVSFQRQVERFEFHAGTVLDMVDATGEGWAFHADLMIVSPLTLKKSMDEIRHHSALQCKRERAADRKNVPRHFPFREVT